MSIMKPIPQGKLDLKPKFKAAHPSRTGSKRALSSIRRVVVHSTETDIETAPGVANFFASPGSTGNRGSAHTVVDPDDNYNCVPDKLVAYHAGGDNDQTLGIEFCGFARWKSWLHPAKRLKELRVGAWQIARWCVKYHIPVEGVSVEELKQNRRGITTHARVSKAFHQSTHTDPGSYFPFQRLLKMVRARVSKLT